MSAVSDRILEQPFHHFVVDRLFPCINDSLQEKVCFFKLVPEEVVVLREFEFRQVILGDDLRTNNIQSCKQPATAGRFLVRDAFAVHFMGKVGVEVVFTVVVDCQFVDVVARDRIVNGFVGRRSFVGLLDFLQHSGRDAALCLLPVSR